MHRPRPRSRPVALLLAGLLPVLSLVVPLLDRGAGGREAVVARPDAAQGTLLRHDHSICVQFAANLSLAAEPGPRLVLRCVLSPRRDEARRTPIARRPPPPRSRSPPRA